MEDKPIISKQSFGLNITLPKNAIKEVQKAAELEIKNISLNPFSNYFEQNDKVFSGEVAGEIRKYQAQIYTLGQIMHEGAAGQSFNTKM